MQGGGRGGARRQPPQANPECAATIRQPTALGGLGVETVRGGVLGLSASLTRGDFTTCRLLGGIMIGCGSTA